MSRETEIQSAYILENMNDDECHENNPPGDISTTKKIKVQVEDVMGASSTQTCEETKPLSDTCNFSTPAPTSSTGSKAKSRISGFQSALTPILKCLNIGSKSQASSKHGSSPRLTVSLFPFGQKSSTHSIQHPSSDFLSHRSGPSVGGVNGPVCCLDSESLPDVTLFDLTCDSTMQLTRNDSALPDSAPTTPVTPRCVNSTFPTLEPSQNKTADHFANQTNSICKNNNTVSSLILNDSTPAGNPRCTSVQDSTMEIHPVKTSTSLEAVNTTTPPQNDTSDCTISFKQTETSESHQSTKEGSCPPVASDTIARAKVKNPEVLPSELGKLTNKKDHNKMVDHLWSKYVLGGDITLLDVTHDSELSPQHDCLKDNRPLSDLSRRIVSVSPQTDVIQEEELSAAQADVIKTSLDATRDITMGKVLESTTSSSEGSGQNVEKVHPANVTRDLSMSSDTSAQSAQASYVMECSTSSKRTELHGETTSNTMKANTEELLANDTKMTSTVLPKPQPAESVNITKLNASSGLNTTAPVSCPQSRTLDLTTSNVNHPKVESECTDQASSATMHQDNSNVRKSGVRNATFDRLSLQNFSDSSVGDTGGATFQVQNNTFDCKPPSKQNGTISLPEPNSSDSDKISSPKVCNLTTDLKEEKSEGHISELSKHDATAPTTEPKANTVETTNSTFEAPPVLEGTPAAGGHDNKDNSDLPMPEGLCNTSKYQVTDTENNKANTFNLDDTLDLRADPLITSTPACKMFPLIVEREDDRLSGARKKMDEDGPSHPAVQVPSDAPSNIICDRKTFLTHSAVKSLWPLSTAPSRLLKFKPASTLPGRFDPTSLTSGVPMTRQRAQTKALKDASASDGSTGISSSYNLRATTTGSKQPSCGLRKPQMSGIPSGIQRPAPGLRPPSARTNAASSSSTEKLCAPTAAANPAVIKPSQAKKHALTRNDNLPMSKRKKTDLPVSSDNAEVSTSTDTTKGTKNLKQPATSRKAVPVKTQRDVAKSTVETSTSCDAAKGARALKQPGLSQRAGKQQAPEATVPANTVEGSNACDAASRVRALKPPATSCQGPLQAKQQTHGCAKCFELEEQLRRKSEEIRTLKEELLKYKTQEEDT